MKHALQTSLKVISESENDLHNQHILSIKIKWVMLMAMIVTMTLLFCGIYFYQQQKKNMLQQVYQYGASLTRFVATETAKAVLSEDWANIELFVKDNVSDQNLVYLKIIDHNNIIRGSNNDIEIGTQYNKLTNIKNITILSQVEIQQYQNTNESTLDFSAPIVFQTTIIGYIHLGLSLIQIRILLLELLWAMAIIAVIIIANVSIATYLLGRQICRPIATLKKAMSEIELRHYSYRIGYKQAKNNKVTNKKAKNKTYIKQDEFSQLFSQFDTMVAAIQKEDEKKSTNEK